MRASAGLVGVIPMPLHLPVASLGALVLLCLADLRARSYSVLHSGPELVVPHDGEPGPTERYCELHYKALETVRRSSAVQGGGGQHMAAQP